MALSANRQVPSVLFASVEAGNGLLLDFQAGAAEQFYLGGFVSLDAGDLFAAPLAAGERFVGIAADFKGTSTGTWLSGASNALNQIRVIAQAAFQHAVTSIAQADISKAIYASDDNTLTLTATSNSSVGRVINVYTTGTAIVQMKMIGETLTQAGV